MGFEGEAPPSAPSPPKPSVPKPVTNAGQGSSAREGKTTNDTGKRNETLTPDNQLAKDKDNTRNKEQADQVLDEVKMRGIDGGWDYLASDAALEDANLAVKGEPKGQGESAPSTPAQSSSTASEKLEPPLESDERPDQEGELEEDGPTNQKGIELSHEQQAKIDKIMEANFGFIEQSTGEIKARGREMVDFAKQSLNSLNTAIGNGAPMDPGYREVVAVTEGAMQFTAIKLNRMSGDLDNLGVTHRRDREEIEDLLKRAATESRQSEAYAFAEAAVAKFNRVSNEIAEVGEGSKININQVTEEAAETTRHLSRISRFVTETTRGDYRDSFAGDVTVRSENLQRALEDIDSALTKQDSEFINASAQNKKEFERMVSELLEKENLEKEPPQGSNQAGKSNPEASEQQTANS